VCFGDTHNEAAAAALFFSTPKKGHSKDLREFFRFSGFVCSLFYFVFLSVGFFFFSFLGRVFLSMRVRPKRTR
jgi:hypothetical protein